MEIANHAIVIANRLRGARQPPAEHKRHAPATRHTRRAAGRATAGRAAAWLAKSAQEEGAERDPCRLSSKAAHVSQVSWTPERPLRGMHKGT